MSSLAPWIDYVIFVTGLALCGLGTTALVMWLENDRTMPWRMLSAFGFASAALAFSQVVALDAWSPWWFSRLTTALAAVAFGSLLGFGRSALSKWYRMPGSWATLVVTATGVLVAALGLPQADLVVRFAIALPAGLVAGSAMLLQASRGPQGAYGASTALRVAAVSLGGYALLAVILGPSAVSGSTVTITHSAARCAVLHCTIGTLTAVSLLMYFALSQAPAGQHASRAVLGRLLAIPLIALIAVAGAIGTNYMGHQADRAGREQLLRRATTVAAMLSNEHILEINGVPADTDNPIYQHVTEELELVLAVNPDLRYAYVMRLIGNNAVFLADGPTDTGSSPSLPGDIYTDASPALLTALKSGSTLIEGPLTDQWGTWITALVPLRSADNGKGVGSLGLDVAADAMSRDIAFARFQAMTVPLAITALALFFLALVQLSRDTSRRLAASEIRFRRQFEIAPEGILLVDPETTEIVEANPFIAKLLGTQPAELVGRRLEEILVPPTAVHDGAPGSPHASPVLESEDPADDVGRTAATALLMAASTGTTEQSVVGSGDRTLSMEFTCTSIDVDGQQRALVFLHDVTLRNRSQSRLAERARLENLVRAISGSFVNIASDQLDAGIDEALALLGTELEVERAYVYSFDDAQQTMSNTHEWVMPHVPSHHDAMQSVTVSTSYPWLTSQLLAGSQVYIPRVSLMPPEADMDRIRLEEAGVRSTILIPMMSKGRVSGFFGFDALKSSRPLEDEVLALINVTADVIAGALNSAEYQKQLESARDEAEAANRAKSDFLATMSHEIRTPMNAIIGMAELLDETPLTEEQSRYTRIFRSAGESLLTLINDILDLSKVEAGRFELDVREFDLEQTVAEISDVMAIRARDKGIELLVRYGTTVPEHAVGDPDRIRQVLVNLIGNAIKFTEQGQVLLALSTTDTGPGSTVLFSVTDTGIGIPQEKLEAIFEAFIQADSSTTRQYGGTGLGLAIARRLVDLMGGDLEVRSESGVGSTFFFSIDLGRAPGDAPTDRAALSGAFILVVDDNATNRLIEREYLESAGAVVNVAENGTVALKMIADADPGYDVVVTDMRMPGISGLELIHRVRESKSTGTAVIVASSDNRPGDAERVRSAGGSALLIKPTRRSEFLSVVARALPDRDQPADSCLWPREAQTDAVPHQPSMAETPPATKPLRILLAEDTEDNRLLVTAYLKNTGHMLETVCDGSLALEAVKAAGPSGFDLVLMDMQMPVMDGYEATRLIREFEQTEGLPRTPIVALTAFALDNETRKAFDAGCDEYLTKPVKKATLLSTVARYSEVPTDD